MLRKIFIDHPDSVDETYGEHFLFAARFSGLLFLAAFMALVHALIPCLFEKSASRIVLGLSGKVANRGHEEGAGEAVEA